MTAKISIVIPAYNEENRIGKVLDGVIKAAKNAIGDFEIIVVDDGSTDNTSKIAEKYGVTALRHPVNRGVGAALVTGFKKAIMNGSDFVITIDADEQHAPEEIGKIAAPVINGEADVVIGSRFYKKNESMPLLKKFGNSMLNLITHLLYGYSCTDTQCGYRAFNKKAIEKMNLTIDRYGIMSEMLGEIKRNKLRLKEVPVSTRYLDKSKGTNVFDGFKIAFDLIIRRFLH